MHSVACCGPCRPNLYLSREKFRQVGVPADNRIALLRRRTHFASGIQDPTEYIIVSSSTFRRSRYSSHRQKCSSDFRARYSSVRDGSSKTKAVARAKPPSREVIIVYSEEQLQDTDQIVRFQAPSIYASAAPTVPAWLTPKKRLVVNRYANRTIQGAISKHTTTVSPRHS